ncbi:hypothetical protein J5226_04095 [Lysobacter sp. K5869]|uniref:hypothetical protein n=1 Tax=Lysobacter sp. K5869 TaxID=2820808 RepID=UPI001C05FCB1|nr:hypothetical protein [Lysobacter sp. K5869]QWP77599.1 hypothetical protein J5226_04095 [Lysobacter sp. K5869]
MRALSPLALCLLLAAGPALAGSDFCDGGGDGPIDPDTPGAPGGGTTSKSGTDPNASSCEVDMIMTLAPFDNGDEYWRLRDLAFTEETQAVLKRAAQWPELPLELKQIRLNPLDAQAEAGTASNRPVPPIKVAPQGQSTFLEWTFVPPEQTGNGYPARMLALTVVAGDSGPVLRADWMIPPNAAWSHADQRTLSPKVIDSQSAELGDYARAPTGPRITLLHDEDQVRVGLGQPVREWISFPLPDAQWRPARLRNGLLSGSELNPGMGLKVKWPTLPRGFLYQDDGDGTQQPAQLQSR